MTQKPHLQLATLSFRTPQPCLNPSATKGTFNARLQLPLHDYWTIVHRRPSLIQYCRHDAIIMIIMTVMIVMIIMIIIFNRRKVDAEER